MTSYQELNEFAYQVRAVASRVCDVYARTDRSFSDSPELLADSLEDLRAVVEELLSAEEELRQQNEELIIARQQLEVERQRYKDLFEFAPDGYLVTDGEGIILEANRAAVSLLNVPANFLSGKPLANFIAQEAQRTFRSKLYSLMQGCRFPEWIVHVQPLEGELFECAVTIAAMSSPNGEGVSLRWQLRDITLRRQVEEQMRQMQLQNMQLLETARLKSQFMAMVSHELRTPMNAIMGFSQLLMRQLQREAVPEQVNMFERILGNGKRLLTLIDDLLDFSKLEAGQLKLNLETVDLTELIPSTVQDLQTLIHQKNLNVQVCLEFQNPLIVNDSDRLRQVLVNLLANAIKFTETGAIEIHACNVEHDRIAIAIKDSGVGIAPTDLQQIFQPFHQLEPAFTRKQGGTGLGLTIAELLVRQMQGSIMVESQLGQGSTFRVELPRQLSTHL